jgi:ADP-ribosylglycohydrolase
MRWLHTQTSVVPKEHGAIGSWLLTQSALFARRAPGNTCLSALGRKGGERNNSKGCGGIMRVAPCGILHPDDPLAAFNLGCLAAKLTHGHPTGYLSAGVFAALIALLMDGQSLERAADTAREILISFPEHEETLSALDAARAMAHRGEIPEKAIPMLGEGWIAEEALAISLYCALSARSLKDGVVMAVNITGDSDSTGAITGNLLGALHGAAAIPGQWRDLLELKEVIEAVAYDLVEIPNSDRDADENGWFGRYPAN